MNQSSTYFCISCIEIDTSVFIINNQVNQENKSFEQRTHVTYIFFSDDHTLVIPGTKISKVPYIILFNPFKKASIMIIILIFSIKKWSIYHILYVKLANIFYFIGLSGHRFVQSNCENSRNRIRPINQ